MKLKVTKAIGENECLCPNCGAQVRYSPQRKRLAIHNLPLTPDKRCPTAKMEAELQLEPEGPMPKLLKLEERPSLKDEPAKGKDKGAGGLQAPKIRSTPVGTGEMNMQLKAKIHGASMT